LISQNLLFLPSCFPYSFPEKPQNQRQQRAQNQAGDNGKIEMEIALGIMDIAGQTSEPRPRIPKYSAREDARPTKNNLRQFAKFADDKCPHLGPLPSNGRGGIVGSLFAIFVAK
jgi:hypothetical protein